MRDISVQTLEELFAEFIPATTLYLLRVVGVDNQGTEITRRYVQNWNPVVSNGQTYQAAAFKIALANDSADGLPAISLAFDSGDSTVINQLRDFDKKPLVYLSVIVAERPDIVEIPETEFEVRSWTIKDTAATINLKPEPILDEPSPADIVTPRLFPLLWENVRIGGRNDPPQAPTEPPPINGNPPIEEPPETIEP